MKGLGLLAVLLLVTGGVAVPAGAPRGPEAEDGPEEPDPALVVVFSGPSEGTDAADPYERWQGAATGRYFTQSMATGYGRLSGRVVLYPSVCVDCELVTPHGTSRERGLLAIQYSFASQDGEPLGVRLAGAVDWEVVFDHEVGGLSFSTNDPLGPPAARRFGHFRHEAHASLENDFEYERTVNVHAPVAITYTALPLDPPEAPLPVKVVEKGAPGGTLRLTYLAE